MKNTSDDQSLSAKIAEFKQVPHRGDFLKTKILFQYIVDVPMQC